MSVYRSDADYLCYDCYLDACEEAEDDGRCEFFNDDEDPYCYPVEVPEKPADAPTHCQGSYCDCELEWE